MRKHTLLAGVIAMLAFTSAMADGRSAAQNLYANLAAGGLALNTKLADIQVASTLVSGMYYLLDAKGKFIAITNEAGTLMGDSHGFNALLPGSTEFRPLTAQEAAGLRREIAENIDKSKLITVRRGTGAVKLFLFSAIDCPYCKQLEDKANAAEKQNKENSTLYIIPSSLQPGNTREGGQQWLKVASIWCATDSARAWKTYWANGAVPGGAGACPFANPQIAKNSNDILWNMLTGAGVALHGTPSIVRMDGLLLRGSNDKPIEPAVSPFWLAGATPVGTDFRPQVVGGGVSSAQGHGGAAQPQPNKIQFGIEDLKKLF